MYEFVHRKLLKRKFAMDDETRVQVLKEAGREAGQQSFMWLFRSGEDGLPPIVLYGYSPTRNGDMAADFLNGFQGYLETDGYQGYNKVHGIKRCACWAHIRRYFIDAIPKGKQYDFSQPLAMLKCENEKLKQENEKLKKVLTKKSRNIISSL